MYDSIPPLNVNNKFITNDVEKADSFNPHFILASSIEEPLDPPPHLPRAGNFEFDLTSINVSEQDVEDQIMCLDVHKAFGPDGILPRL